MFIIVSCVMFQIFINRNDFIINLMKISELSKFYYHAKLDKVNYE